MRRIFNSFDVEPHWVTLPVRHDRSYWDQKPDLSTVVLRKFLKMCLVKKQSCTFFVVGAYARRFPENVRLISNMGFEVGSHSMWHEDMASKTDADFEEDVRSSKDLLEQLIQKPVLGFRAPSFSIMPRQLQILASVGYRYDASTTQSLRFHGGGNLDHSSELDSNSGLIVFPFRGHRLFNQEVTLTGGGYFRLIPPILLRTVIESSSFNGFYFHAHDFEGGYQREANIDARTHALRSIHVGNTFSKVSSVFDCVGLSSFEEALMDG